MPVAGARRPREELVEEARVEDEENSGQPCSYDEAQEFVDSWRRDVNALIEGRTSWLVRRGNEAPDVAPAWFLDFQRELAEIDISREWISGLDHMVARLTEIETLILPQPVPEECKATMSQAALCYRYGLFRAPSLSRRGLRRPNDHRASPRPPDTRTQGDRQIRMGGTRLAPAVQASLSCCSARPKRASGTEVVTFPLRQEEKP